MRGYEENKRGMNGFKLKEGRFRSEIKHPGEYSEALKMTGRGIAGRGYKIQPILHGIFNCPMGRGGKEAGRLGKKSASTQLRQ